MSILRLSSRHPEAVDDVGCARDDVDGRAGREVDLVGRDGVRPGVADLPVPVVADHLDGEAGRSGSGCRHGRHDPDHEREEHGQEDDGSDHAAAQDHRIGGPLGALPPRRFGAGARTPPRVVRARRRRSPSPPRTSPTTACRSPAPAPSPGSSPTGQTRSPWPGQQARGPPRSRSPNLAHAWREFTSRVHTRGRFPVCARRGFPAPLAAGARHRVRGSYRCPAPRGPPGCGR